MMIIAFIERHAKNIRRILLIGQCLLSRRDYLLIMVRAAQSKHFYDMTCYRFSQRKIRDEAVIRFN